MTTEPTLSHLSMISEHRHDPSALTCVALSHNERTLLPEFLDHYRSLGRISFLIVDDRSTDGTRDYLLAQPDVTTFEPESDSTYAQHKRQWRSELLDTYADGAWCLAPDIDEHLVYPEFKTRSLAAVIDELDTQGAEALHATMVDMYADKPLRDHVYRDGGLWSEFPLFDGPESYWLLPGPTRFRRKYPTPFLLVYGGMRKRLFLGNSNGAGRVQHFLLDHFANMNRSFNPTFVERTTARLTRQLAKPLLPRVPFTCSKLTLLKWRKGMCFSGGSHAISQTLKISEHSAVLLHFKFTRGLNGLKYIAQRGQHAYNSLHYRQILGSATLLDQSPLCPWTRRLDDNASLQGILR